VCVVRRLYALSAAFGFGLCAFAAPVPRDRVPPNDKAIKARFYQCWHEEWREECDPKGNVEIEACPPKLSAYEFGERGGWIWGWGGELSPASDYAIALDTTRTPMRFDKISYGKGGKPDGVIPGIFKFDGPRLILATPYSVRGWRKWDASGEYKDRPTDFERRPGVVIAVLERCEYLDQSRP
jgi:hypothetical protein